MYNKTIHSILVVSKQRNTHITGNYNSNENDLITFFDKMHNYNLKNIVFVWREFPEVLYISHHFARDM